MRKNSERSCRSNIGQHRTTRTRNTTIKLMPPGAIRSRCGNHVIISTLSRSGLNATKLGANKSGDRLLCWRLPTPMRPRRSQAIRLDGGWPVSRPRRKRASQRGRLPFGETRRALEDRVLRQGWQRAAGRMIKTAGLISVVARMAANR
jgi:hypothetical protein